MNPFVCRRLGVEPGQPFLVHGYPGRNYPPLVYLDGQIRIGAPDGRRGHKVGGRAVCWMMDHPECVEPCREVAPGEAVGKREGTDMDKKEKPRMCEILGVEVGERFRVQDGSCCLYPEAFVDEGGILRSGAGYAPMNGRDVCRMIKGELYISRCPRWTQQEAELMERLETLNGGKGGRSRWQIGL